LLKMESQVSVLLKHVHPAHQEGPEYSLRPLLEDPGKKFDKAIGLAGQSNRSAEGLRPLAQLCLPQGSFCRPRARLPETAKIGNKRHAGFKS
jgi:hypothetical protein